MSLIDLSDIILFVCDEVISPLALQPVGVTSQLGTHKADKLIQMSLFGEMYFVFYYFFVYCSMKMALGARQADVFMMCSQRDWWVQLRSHLRSILIVMFWVLMIFPFTLRSLCFAVQFALDRRDTVANAHCSESFVLFESICLQSTFERRYLLAKGKKKEERKKT